jgi:hypothetical protein
MHTYQGTISLQNTICCTWISSIVSFLSCLNKSKLIVSYINTLHYFHHHDLIGIYIQDRETRLSTN